jgi:transposase
MTLPQIKKLHAKALLERFNAKESQIAQQQVEIDAQKTEIAQQQVEIDAQKTEIAQLLSQLDYLKRKLYGSGDGESTDKLQMELSELLAKLEPGAIQASEVEVEVPDQRAQRRTRKPLRPRSERYAHLPIKETIEIIPDEVLAAPDDYELIDSVEETFEIDFNQIEFYRRTIRRLKFRRKAAKGSEAPVVAPAPVRLSGGIASAHLIALILIAKYWDHLPLHRQVRQYRRYGCELSLDSMVRWVAKAGEWLDRIHERMRWELLQGDYIQVDETPIDFCDPDSGLKRTRKGYLCGISCPGQSVVFDWRKDRSHEAVTRSLQGYEGFLQADAYQAYVTLEKENPLVILIGCMAHMRRKFTDCVKGGRASRACALIIKMIARLYCIEAQIRESKTPMSAAQIKAYRQKHVAIKWKWLGQLIHWQAPKALPKSPMAKACTYAVNNWQYFSNYLENGEVQIDNNLMENCIRPTKIGAKNWLFIGHPDAGQRSAIIYSVLISCQRLGVDPDAYLSEVFAVDTAQATDEKIAQLTPRAFAERRKSEIES